MKINEKEVFGSYEILATENINITSTKPRCVTTDATVTLSDGEICLFIPESPFSNVQYITSGEQLSIVYINSSTKHIPLRISDVLGRLVSIPSAKTISNFTNINIPKVAYKDVPKSIPAKKVMPIKNNTTSKGAKK